MAIDSDLEHGVLSNIGELWLEEEFCDLTINIDDYQFRCHKFHLSANSAFFKTLLRSEKTDGSTNSISHMTIRSIDPEIFGLVLKAVYKGENCVDENNMIQVWHAADELQIDVLVSKCEDFVMAHMTLKNYENIYYSSVLLESTRVKKFALDFMAKIFDKFRQTVLFLDLPSKYLMDILNSEVLVVGARRRLVDSILMWAKHKADQNDESIDNTVEVKANELDDQTKGDKQCVEIMFSQPPAGLEDESSRRKLRQILQETETREETLGKLLNLAKLEQTSLDYLKSLVDNDWLMCIKEARNAVWEANTTLLTAKPPTIDKVIELQTTSPGYENLCKDAVVYKLRNSDNILVHLGTSGKRYGLLTHIDVLHSLLLDKATFYSTTPVYLQSKRSDQSDAKFMINGREYALGDLKLPQDTSHPVVVRNNLYIIRSKADLCRLELRSKEMKSNSWLSVATIHKRGVLRWVAVHEETIVVSYWPINIPVTCRFREQIQLYSFFTSTLSLKYLGKIDYADSNDAVVFINHEMYILQANGYLWHVSLTSDPEKGVTRLTRLWSLKVALKMYSVIKVQNDLIIFAELPPGTLFPTYCECLDLNLKFVQAWPQDNKCRHVWIPQSWLGKEI